MAEYFKIEIYIYIHVADENITGAHHVKGVYVALPMHVCSNCGITSYKYSLWMSARVNGVSNLEDQSAVPGFFRTGWWPNQGGAYSHILSPLVASALGFPGSVEGSGDVFD